MASAIRSFLTLCHDMKNHVWFLDRGCDGCFYVQIGFFLFAAIGFNNFGQQEGNEEIY